MTGGTGFWPLKQWHDRALMKLQFIFLKRYGFWRLFAAVALLFCATVGREAWAQAVTATHCSQEEKIVFSCPFKNKKTVSLCASANLTKDTGTLQYRYGVVGEPLELAFPNKAQAAYAKTGHPKRFFSMSLFAPGEFSAYERKSISFKNTVFYYEINQGIHRKSFRDPYMLNVTEIIAQADAGDKPIKAKYICEKANTIENLTILKPIEITPFDKLPAFE